MSRVGPVSNNPVAAGCDAIAALYIFTQWDILNKKKLQNNILAISGSFLADF